MDAPDSIHIELLDGRALAKRRRRFSSKSPSGLELLPAEWRSLLACWVKRGGKSRWETLLKDAGTAHLTLADSLRDWLLREGWAEVIEERRHGDWWPLWLELRELPALRAALGLNDKETDARRWESARAELAALNDDVLAPALAALDELPIHRALARHDLIAASLEWRAAERNAPRFRAVCARRHQVGDGCRVELAGIHHRPGGIRHRAPYPAAIAVRAIGAALCTRPARPRRLP